MKPVLSDREMEDGQTLRRRLLAMGLDPRGPDGTPGGWSRATLARRRAWVQWAIAYRSMGGRPVMLRHGYLFPPVQPAGDVDAEWRQFERWMTGATSRNTVRRQPWPRRIPLSLSRANRVAVHLRGAPCMASRLRWRRPQTGTPGQDRRRTPEQARAPPCALLWRMRETALPAKFDN